MFQFIVNFRFGLSQNESSIVSLYAKCCGELRGDRGLWRFSLHMSDMSDWFVTSSWRGLLVCRVQGKDGVCDGMSVSEKCFIVLWLCCLHTPPLPPPPQPSLSHSHTPYPHTHTLIHTRTHALFHWYPTFSLSCLLFNTPTHRESTHLWLHSLPFKHTHIHARMYARAREHTHTHFSSPSPFVRVVCLGYAQNLTGHLLDVYRSSTHNSSSGKARRQND